MKFEDVFDFVKRDKKPRGKRKFKGKEEPYRSPAEILTVIDDPSVSLRDAAFIVLMYETGCRVSEAIKVRREDIKDEGNCWTITHPVIKKRSDPPTGLKKWVAEKHISKSNEFDVKLMTYLLGYISHKKLDDVVFPFTRRTGWNIVFPLLNERPHRLRHWYATRLRREKDMDIQEIQEYMLWRFVRDAARYSHVTKASLKNKVIK